MVEEQASPKLKPQSQQQHSARLANLVTEVCLEIIRMALDFVEQHDYESEGEFHKSADFQVNVLTLAAQASADILRRFSDAVNEASRLLDPTPITRQEQKPANEATATDTSNPRSQPPATDKKGRALWT